MRLSRCCLLVACVACLFIAPLAAAEETTAEELINSQRPLIIAHRGDSLTAPENTLPAFQAAVDVGSDLVELDYVHSSDGVPFVIHDDTLDRTTDAKQIFGGEKITLQSKSVKELERLDAGAWFDPKFTGTKLPTLEAALDTIQKGSMTLIERKEGEPKTLIDLLRKNDLLESVVVQSFDWEFLAECHALAPELVLGALGAKELSTSKLDEIKKSGAKIVGWHYLYLSRQRIGMIHDAGLKSWAWTVDEPRWATRLVKWGLDGVITNMPGKMKTLLSESSTPEQSAELER